MEFKYSDILGDSEALALYECAYEHTNLFTLYFSFLFRKVSNLSLILIDVASLIKRILCNCDIQAVSKRWTQFQRYSDFRLGHLFETPCILVLFH